MSIYESFCKLSCDIFYQLENLIEDGEFEKAHDEINKMEHKLKNRDEKIFIKLLTYKIDRMHGKYEETGQKLREFSSSIPKEEKYLKLYYLIELTWNIRQMGELEESHQLITEASRLVDELSHYSAKFNDVQTSNFNVLRGAICHNLGVVYLEKGDINTAIDTTREGLEYRQRSGKLQLIADSLNNLGVMIWYSGDLDNSFSYLVQCAEIRKNSGNFILYGLTLLNLVQLSLLKGKGKTIEDNEYFKLLEELQSKHSDNMRLYTYYWFAKALILKESKRFKRHVEAENIFYDLINREILDGQHTFLAYYNLADLLLYELRINKEEELLEEIRSLIKKLRFLAEEKGVHVVLSRAYLLQSKLDLIEGRIQDAKDNLQSAWSIAERINDNRLLITISNEYDLLLNQEDELRSIKNNDDIETRLNLINIDSLLSKFASRDLNIDNVKSEIPILFLITNSSGSMLYSKRLNNDFISNENLISSFISAINDFSNELFASKGNLERIKHQDFTILIKKEGFIIYNYIFKGSSYFATRKLKALIEKASELPMLKNNKDGNLLHTDMNFERNMNTIFSDVFSDNSIMNVNSI